MPRPPAPKIELHVHLEGAVRPKDLFDMATRNRFPLPVGNEAELARLYRLPGLRALPRPLEDHDPGHPDRSGFPSGRHLLCGRGRIPRCRLHRRDLHPVRAGGRRRVLDEVFSGFCDGAAEAKERFGVEIRLTPDTPRDFGLDVAMKTARYAIKYKGRGIAGLGLGGPEASYPPEPFERAFRLAKDEGLARCRTPGRSRPGIGPGCGRRPPGRSDPPRHRVGGGWWPHAGAGRQVHRV